MISSLGIPTTQQLFDACFLPEFLVLNLLQGVTPEANNLWSIEREERSPVYLSGFLHKERNKDIRRKSLQMKGIQHFKPTLPESMLLPNSPLPSLLLGLLSTRIPSLKSSKVVDLLQ